MANFPGPENAPRAGSLAPQTGIVRDDSYREIEAGAQALGAGISRAGAGLMEYHRQEKKKENTADLAAAEAEWLKGSLDIGNRYSERADYEDFPGQAKGEIEQLKERAAAMIRDDNMRSAWLGDAQLKAISLADGVDDQARSLKRADDSAKFETSIETNASLIADPTISDDMRDRARADVTGALIRGIDTGLITREQGKLYKQKFLDAAEENLSINRGLLELKVAPEKVMIETGISAAIGGQEVGSAAISTAGGSLPLTPEIATAVAASIGDNALPTDPKLQKAYLADPEIANRYTTAAVDMLTSKYKGDFTAAIIALAPGGGEQMAKEWIASGHDESALPPKVRAYYRETVDKTKAPAEVIHLPVQAAPGIEMDNIDAAVLDRWEKTQNQFGGQLTIIGGKRANLSAGMDGIDIDVSKLKPEDKVRLIETASSMGFSGIGVYDDKTVHLDFGTRRAFGPDQNPDAIPGWASDVMEKHANGDITQVPVANANVDPKYAALSFDQRMKLYNEAKQELDRKAIESRAGIEVAAANAPVSIMAHGRYDGFVPTADDFVKAYGAADGIGKYKEFSGAMEVASAAYDMRTMSLDDIATMLETKVPASTGDNASYEAKRYNALVEAAATVKEVREKDPAGYVLQVAPDVATLYKQFGKDPASTAMAVNAMDAAQDKLGITKKVLLPKAVADKAVAIFNNAELDGTARFDALVGTVYATNDEEQQRTILRQLKDSGVPSYVDPVFEALSRNDQDGARYLMRAAVVDPTKIPKDLGAKQGEIDGAIGAVYSEGGVGDVYYGLNGSPNDKNFTKAVDDSVLFERAVKLRLMDGSASNLDQAVALTTRDMFGDIKVARQAGNANRAGMQVTIPTSETQRDYELGFTMLLPSVADAIKSSTDPALAGLSTADGSLQMTTLARDNDLKMTLRDGYFANAGPGEYQFLDMDGMAVTDRNGKVLTFTTDDVKAAAKLADPGMQTLSNYEKVTGGNSYLTQRGYLGTIGGSKPLTRDPFK